VATFTYVVGTGGYPPGGAIPGWDPYHLYYWHPGDGNVTIDGGPDHDTLIITGNPVLYDEEGKGYGGSSWLQVVVEDGAITRMGTFVDGTIASLGTVANVETVMLDLGDLGKLDYAGTTEAVTVNLAAGTATGFTSITGVYGVYGGSGNDTLTGDAGYDTLAGGAGLDTLTGGEGVDVLYGGADGDILHGGGDDDWIYGDIGCDTLTGGTGVDRFVGDLSELNGDRITDYQTGEKIILDGSLSGASNVQLVATGADTKLQIDGDNNGLFETVITLNGTISGAINLSSEGSFTNNVIRIVTPNLAATAGNDLLVGTSADETIDGLEGDDEMFGLAGNDTLIGGTGGDKLYGGDGNDDLSGGAGINYLYGGAGDDRLKGGDALVAGEYYVHDILTGGVGADTFVFGSMADATTNIPPSVITDWEASDTIDLAAIDADTSIDGNQDFTFLGLDAANSPWVAVGQGQLKYYQYGGTTYIIGNMTADNQADFQIEINGLHDFSAHQILGLAPSAPPTDIAVVGGGSLAANEFIADGTLVGTVVGHDPDSTVFTYSLVDDAGGRFMINASTGAITVGDGLVLDFEQNLTHVIRVRVEDQAHTSFEKDFTVAINNVDPENLIGDATANTFVGGALNDVFSGAGGSDALVGGAGNDNLSGNAGEDVLTGGLGRDILSGGTEADTFVFTSTADSVVGTNCDVITEWQIADIIDVARIDANTSAGGNQDFTFIGLGAANLTVREGQLKYYQSGGNTFVVGNTTADNRADFQIQISGLHTLTSADFFGVV
jgi:Ca2+-binding RTX toxin-like protein